VALTEAIRTKKPFVLALDDDPAVLKAVERDLKAKFSGAYRILASDTPAKALELVRQLTARGDRVALFLVDQRMPLMSGTEFLREAMARAAYRLCRFQRGD
jgi:thioredoxin reductase (NADPH)